LIHFAHPARSQVTGDFVLCEFGSDHHLEVCRGFYRKSFTSLKPGQVKPEAEGHLVGRVGPGSFTPSLSRNRA
jgi:hypothetical protein